LVLTGPLIVPAWKLELAGPKDIADAIAAEWAAEWFATRSWQQMSVSMQFAIL
jgi:hypothetical protein